MDYPDNTKLIISKVLEEQSPDKEIEALHPGKKVYSIKEFRKLIFKKIAASL